MLIVLGTLALTFAIVGACVFILDRVATKYWKKLVLMVIQG